ncbi:MAG: NrsF family protein [Granulosicoccaceae bacterium]
MKTQDLINMMAQESQAQVAPLRAFSPSALGALVLSTVALLLFWGIRPDLTQAISNPLVLTKNILPALTAIPCLWLLAQARHPDTSLNGALRWLWLPLVIVLGLFIYALISSASATWLETIKGQTLLPCLVSIPLLAAPILAALLWAMSSGAASRPALAGAIAGLAAGCLATSIYALHCFEDSPAFYGLWYTAAIALTGLLGRWAGKHLLKW